MRPRPHYHKGCTYFVIEPFRLHHSKPRGPCQHYLFAHPSLLILAYSVCQLQETRKPVSRNIFPYRIGFKMGAFVGVCWEATYGGYFIRL